MKHLASVTAITSVLCAACAYAADLPSRKTAPVYDPPAPLVLWTGFYGGLNLGGGWVDGGNTANLAYADPGFPVLAVPAGFAASNLFLLPDATTGTSTGIVGGGQVGYSYQVGPSFVFGVEADLQGTSIQTGSGTGFTAFPSPYAATNVLVPLERIRLKPAHILRRRRNLRIPRARTPSAIRRFCSIGRRRSARRLCGAEL